MTPTVWSKVSRYFTSDPESAIVVNHAPSSSGLDAGSACPTSAASSTMVAGRRPPSRWSCSSTLGARWTCSRVTGGPALGSVRTALMRVILSKTEGNGVRTFTDIEQLAAAVGEELGTSDWFEIDQERVNTFADATDDHQWIHVDEERAKAGPFGGTIAHGYMTLSLIPTLSHSIFSIETDGPR